MLSFVFFLVFGMSGLVNAQKAEIKQLLHALENTAIDSIKGRIYNQLSAKHWYSDPNKALQYAHEALRLGQTSNNQELIIQAYRNQGATYWILGEYPHALEQFQKMLDLSKKNQNRSAMAQAFNNLAMIYKAQNSDSIAINLYKQSLNIHEEQKNTKGMAIVSGNLGAAYLNAGNLEESLQYNFKALKLGEQIGRKRTIGNAYNNIGEVYVHKFWYKRALDYYQKALTVYQEMGEKWSIGHAKNGLATCLLHQNKLNKALGFAEESYQIGISLGAKELIKDACENLMKIYEKQKRYQSAFTYQHLYHLYTDSLINETKNKSIHQLELTKRDAENALLRKQQEVQQLANDRQSIIIFSIGGAMISSLILTVVFFRSRQKARKLNVALKMKNTKIQAINKQLEISKQEIVSQNIQLTTQGEAIAKQKDLLEGRNEQITRSITTAKTIQQAMLPYPTHINEFLSNYFIVYRPKAIVSGDFYWFNKIDGKVIVAAIDCTGHGVPGAFMSMIGNTLLDNLISLKRETNPADILMLLDHKVLELLHHKENNNYYGMDAGIVTLSYRSDNQVDIVFAGAKRPLFYVSEGDQEIQMLASTNKSIGGKRYRPRIFENQKITLPKGSMIYLSSDGFEDQHNEQRRKIGRARLGKLLHHCASLPIREQKQRLEQKLDDYMHTVDQRDDILLIGIRL